MREEGNEGERREGGREEGGGEFGESSDGLCLYLKWECTGGVYSGVYGWRSVGFGLLEPGIGERWFGTRSDGMGWDRIR